MSLKTYLIRFDNPDQTYFSNETVNGSVDFTLDAPEKIKEIKIQFKGEANTIWTGKRSRVYTDETGNLLRSLDCIGHEEYFRTEYDLVGNKGGEIELLAGSHSYPFSYSLPSNLPSSYEGENGYVRYTVRVVLDCPWKSDQSIKAAFTVILKLDLNHNALVKEPFTEEIIRDFCCFCCKTGMLSVAVNVPITGFVCGQKIPINLQIHNNSGREILKVHFRLMKKETCHSQIPNQKIKEEECEILVLSVSPGNQNKVKSFKNEMDIPPLAPSLLTNCHIIDLEYFLQVDVDISGFSFFYIQIKIPIVLGTMPISTEEYEVESKLIDNQTSSCTEPNITQKTPIDVPLSLDDEHLAIPPPTFQPSQYGTTSIKEDFDDADMQFAQDTESFAPRYPVFEFPLAVIRKRK